MIEGNSKLNCAFDQLVVIRQLLYLFQCRSKIGSYGKEIYIYISLLILKVGTIHIENLILYIILSIKNTAQPFPF